MTEKAQAETMKNAETIGVDGRVRDVFAHRFVIETASGDRVLADLGPDGATAFALESGVEIVAFGKMKPSELKVSSIATKGGEAVAIRHGRKDKLDGDAKASQATNAVVEAGFEAVGGPRRKPKHFEVLGRKDGNYIECHVEFDGTIRKKKPVETGDDKWAAEMNAAA